MRFAAMLSVITFVFISFAGTATQTDWAGGDGIPGPVTDWGDEFYTDTDLQYYIYPSNVVLQKVISGGVLEYTVDGNFNAANSVYAADINGDGYMDVLGSSYNDNDITWWENDDGTGTSWTEHTVDADFVQVIEVYSEDVDGDGDMDVLGAAGLIDDITWWENNDGSGTSWTEHTIDGDFDGAYSVHCEDIDGDGYMDVLGAAILAGDITWWENVDGSGTSWTKHAIVGDFDGAFSVYSEDVNGDGYMDVLGAAYNADDITWWENEGGSGTSWTEHIVDGDFDDARSVYSADVNGDGDMDVLGAAYNADDITWWENDDGTGTSWTEHTIDGDFDGAYSVYSEDVDGDGDMDVLGAAIHADDITWWENESGSGTSWTEHTIDGDFDGAYSVYSEDINGDGYLDILGAAWMANDIAWWNCGALLPVGSLESSILDVQESPEWQILLWSSTEQAGTSIGLQVRASKDPYAMGSWSDTLTAPCMIDEIINDGDSLFQYRVILNTNNPYSTPVLHDVTVTWLPMTGIHEESAGEITSYALYGAQPNPSSGNVTLTFALPVDSSAELSVYDLSGRLVKFISDDFTQGVTEVAVDDLACGLYIVRMISGEFTATRQFVIIE